MDDSLQIRLSGKGGQGLITAGVILAEAALLDGLHVVQTQMYGPSARLGASRSEVIIAREPIAYPEVARLDILLCLSQEAFDKYIGDTHPKTQVVCDSSLVDIDAVAIDRDVAALPITACATEVGGKIAANVVALGVINRLTGVVSQDHLREAVLNRIPNRFQDLNEQALGRGYRLTDLLTSNQVGSAVD